ncbi:beta-galactosidase [Actinoplanes sp. CA-142083]|uniref:beta-galactosidase n=1 Tax=Actinoplanes sp. CA-142083 TaxID=3239903 RepID=UPI003D91A8E4
MANDEDVRPGLSLTDRFLRRDGQPWIPVSGELHYSRVPRDRWAERLRLMRSGGITVVSTYVPWIHHVPERGAPSFDGNLDVAAFVDLCRATGLEVVLRIGPWVHGEIRNGGFPDWVQRAPVAHRTDDPGYLELVREWFGRLGAALAGRSPVLAIQLENELYDEPDHLVTLKGLARSAGMSAPLWTATAWDGAKLPADEVMPVHSGYGDGFWADAWDDTFRQQYFFADKWDSVFPPVTCELGGGMATAYHRRPWPSALDVAAVAHCKIGGGSVWQGYYMYAGGTNPPGTQESHATGYPNDMPPLGYDFHAPIGEAGALAASHATLRRQHAFLAAFTPDLTRTPSSLPDLLPANVHDTTTLRWAVRGSFLFVAWHQPHVPLATYRGAQFRVRSETEELLLPSEPVDIPPGTLARWPLALDVAGVRIDWATASALTVLPGPVPTLVLCAEPGIPVELAVHGLPPRTVAPGHEPVRVRGGDQVLDVLVLPAGDADAVWVAESRRLLLSEDRLGWGVDGRVVATTAGPAPAVRVYDPARRAFRPLSFQGDATLTATEVVAMPLRAANLAVPDVYGMRDSRQSAPSAAAFDELAAIYRLTLPDWAQRPESDALLSIDWAGDVAQLRVDGRPVTDRFWDGSRWQVSLRDAGCIPTSEVTLHILPLSAASPVQLPAEAAARAGASPGQLLAVDGVRVEAQRAWHEADSARPGPATVRGVIDVDLPGHRISRHVYGHFAEHLGRCIYGGFFVGEDSPIPHEGGIRLDVVQALRELAIPNLRWPGGCFADEYHWRDGIGPRDRRPRMVNSHWGDIVEDNSFGTHEFMALCELLGAEPYIATNVGSGTVREAGEWAEYLTRAGDSPMATLRRSNGRDEPWQVRFWGLGNEPWGCGGGMRAEAYADLARVFGTYSRDHGGNRLYRIAAGASGDDYRWTEVLMRALGHTLGSTEVTGHGTGTFQAISLHHYTVPGPWEHKGSATEFDVEEYYWTMAKAARIEEILAGHARVMDAYDPGRTVGLVLDEWGTWYEVEPGTHPGFLFQQNTLRDALVAGLHLDAFHRHADRLVMANIAQTVNVLQAMLLTDGDALVRTPSFHVFAMNKGHQDADSLDVRLPAPPPVRRVAHTDLATFHATASRRDGQVLISLTNLDADQGLAVELHLRGARLGHPTAAVLTADALNAHNTPQNPDTVRPRPLDDVRIEDGVLCVRLPRHAFATVALPLLP